MISPGDKVIVEGPTFLATIQCFRLYGARTHQRADRRPRRARPTSSNKLIAQHKPKFVYLIPTFGNPSGALLSLERRKKVLEMAVKHQTLIVEDDPYGDLYFGEAPPPSLLALSPAVPGSRELLAHCGSLSKVLSPGLRVGWMIAPRRTAGQGHHVQAVQRRPHQHLRAGHAPPSTSRAGRMPDTLKLACARSTANAPHAMGKAAADANSATRSSSRSRRRRPVLLGAPHGRRRQKQGRR